MLLRRQRQTLEDAGELAENIVEYEPYMDPFWRKADVEPHDASLFILDAKAEAAISTKIAKADQARPFIDVSPIAEDCHLDRLRDRPAIFSAGNRCAISIKAITVVSAKIVWAAQSRLQVEGHHLIVFGKSSRVANVKDQGSHAVGEGQIVCRLCGYQVKVCLTTTLIEEP